MARPPELSKALEDRLGTFLGTWTVRVSDDWQEPPRIEEAIGRISRYAAPLILESRRKDPRLGRYSFLTADPIAYLSYDQEGMTLWLPGRSPMRLEQDCDPFMLLSACLGRWQVESTTANLPPFVGGWAGWFGYELGSLLEPVPPAATNDLQLPWLGIGLYDWCLVIDQLRRRCYLVVAAPQADDRGHERAAWATAVLSGRGQPPRALVGLTEPAPLPPLPLDALADAYPTPIDGLWSNFDLQRYLAAVRRVLTYIRAGDIYQANLSQRLIARCPHGGLPLYLRLRRTNPAFFAAYHRWGGMELVSCSPEQFLRVGPDGAVETRPIKGTRSRWPYPEADLAAREDLATSQKDRAENVMIVDLLRNDLGRVCAFGSVKVAEALRVYSFPYVHHLVSTVVGRLRPERTAADLLRAAFPGGSITGAPKVRAMQIIAELEPTVRGPYCGAIGLLSLNGSMETSIAIRTMTCHRGWVQLPVGGGIVADSEPEAEYEETWHKARGMLTAVLAATMAPTASRSVAVT